MWENTREIYSAVKSFFPVEPFYGFCYNCWQWIFPLSFDLFEHRKTTGAAISRNEINSEVLGVKILKKIIYALMKC